MAIHTLTRLGGVSLLLFTTATFAQDLLIEEVVVTAQKREQNMQDVGISVTALSGDQLKELGLSTSTEVIAQTPNIEMQNVWGEFSPNTQIAIRGVAMTDFNDGHESPATIYVDEFYVLPMAAANFSMYDLERVEALRGPQGTLFGRNSTGGLLHYVTKKPTAETEGYIDVTAGEFGLLRAEGAVGGGLSETVSGRVSVLYNEQDGHVSNNLVPGEKRFGNEVSAIRAQLAFDPNDRLRINLKGEYAESTSNMAWQGGNGTFVNADGFVQFVPDNQDIYGTCPGCTAYGTSEDGDPTSGNFNSPGEFNVDTYQLNAKVEYEFDTATFTSVTGYLDFDKHLFDEDCDGTIVDVCRTNTRYVTDQFTQEFRFNGETDRTRWTAGAFYLTTDGKADQAAPLFGDILDLAFGDPTLAGFAFVVDSQWQIEADSWSLFGQLEYDVSDTVTLIGGVRYTDDEKQFELYKTDFISTSTMGTGPDGNDYENLIPGFFFGGMNFTANGDPIIAEVLDANGNPVIVSLDPVGADATRQNFDNFAVKAEIDWRPTDNLLVYGSYNRGHKAGGFNNGFVSGADVGAGPETIPYDEEVLNAFEIGFKADLADGRARLNGAVFHYDYKDHQAFSFVGLGGFLTNNDATITGAELELIANPFDGFELSLGAATLDTEVKDILNAGGQVNNNEMGLAPDFSLNGIARYGWEGLGGWMTAQLDFSHTGKRFVNVQNNLTDVLDEITTANARVSWSSESDNWSVALWVKNLTDERKPVSQYELSAIGGSSQIIYQPPRWYGATLTYRF